MKDPKKQNAQSAEMPEIGKISPEIFTEVIFPRLGAKSCDIIVGPQHGVDVGIVEIGDKAVSFTTDPVFIVPQYGWERAAWFAIHIIISDSVTSGLETEISVHRFESPDGYDQRAISHCLGYHS